MKTTRISHVIFLAILFLVTPVCVSQAAHMVIRFNDGSTVIHDTGTISSITFGSVPQAAPAAYLLNEEFAAGLSTLWEPIQVVGGNFERFATLSSGKLAVNVPSGNSWGKTGIMSRGPLFSVDAGMATSPLKMTFEFDPGQTTGYVIALAQAKDADVWRVQNYWLHWGRPTMISGKLYAANTQNSGDKGSDATTQAQAPNTVTLAIRPGSVEATTSHGTRLAMNLGWMKTGVPVYLYIFSHPWNQHEAASFTLKAIRISQ